MICQIILLPTELDKSVSKVCHPNSHGNEDDIDDEPWLCQDLVLVIPMAEYVKFLNTASHNHQKVVIEREATPRRVEREAVPAVPAVSLTQLPQAIVQFAVVNISGVPMLCRKEEETPEKLFQCQPVFPDEGGPAPGPGGDRHQQRSLPDNWRQEQVTNT